MDKTMRISFRAKPDQWHDGRQFVTVPTLARRHCDMNAARSHPRYGAYANSDFFPSMLARIRQERFPDGRVFLDSPPEGVVISPGFLVTVEFRV